MKTITKEQLFKLLRNDGDECMLRFEGQFAFSFVEGKTSMNFLWSDEDEEFNEEVDLTEPLEVRGNVVLLPQLEKPDYNDELEIYLPLGSTKTLEDLCA